MEIVHATRIQLASAKITAVGGAKTTTTAHAVSSVTKCVNATVQNLPSARRSAVGDAMKEMAIGFAIWWHEELG